MKLVRLWAAVVVAAVLGVSGIAVPANAETAGSPGCRPRIAALELPAGTVHSGAGATGTVRLDCAAHRPVRMVLTSADPAWVGVPARVTVPAGRTAAAFPIRTYQPDYIYGDFSVLITAKMRGREISRPLSLQPGLKFLQVDTSVISGDSVFVNFGVNGTAPEGGMTVQFESDNEALSLPASITIPRGALGLAGSYGKTVRIPHDAEVTITARLPGQSLTAVVAVQAWTYDPGDWSLTGSGTLYGGGFTYTMTLDLPNPVPHGGVDVTFTSDNPRMNLPFPMALTEGTSGALPVRISAPYDIDDEVTITATIEGVGSTSHTVRVHPGLKEVELPWPLYGGRTFEGTVHLGTATSEPLTVRLTTDDPALRVPAEVVVPAGASSATFTGTTADVQEFVTITLTAELGGSRREWTVFVDPAPE
jgi:hypothetical protein